MAQKFLTNIDLNQNQIVNATFEVVGSDPGSGNFEGRLIYNSTEDTIKVYTGSAWRKMLHNISSGGGAGIAEALTVSESNGTVTLTLNVADTDSAGLLSANFWNKLNDATSDATASKLVQRDANGQAKFGTPTDPAHAATKGYVDSARTGLDVKESVKLATAAALSAFTHSNGVLTASANGGLSVDGVTLSDPADVGIRILVKNETSTNEPFNGIYTVTAVGDAGNPWVLTRASDADSSAEVTAGMFTFVEQGSANADSGWVLTTDGSITLGTTNITFAQFSGAGSITAGDGLSKSGNTFNVGAGTGITVNADTVQISATYSGQSSITTLGTITTGTWNGTTIAVANGGTGATDAPTARTNLGLAIGTDVQAYDAELAAIAGLTSAANKLPYFTGSGTASLADFTSQARDLLDDTSFSAMRTTLGLAIGTDVQAYNSTLAAVAGGTYTGDDSIATIGTITSGTWNGTTIAVAYGGTGATTEANARDNLAATTAGYDTNAPTLARISRKGCAASVTNVSTTTVTHNFNTTNVIVQVYSNSTGETVVGDVTRTSANAISVVLNGNISANDYWIVVTG